MYIYVLCYRRYTCYLTQHIAKKYQRWFCANAWNLLGEYAFKQFISINHLVADSTTNINKRDHIKHEYPIFSPDI